MAKQFSIQFERDTLRDIDRLPLPARRDILRDIEKYLSEEPHRPFGTRIKKLHHLKIPLYRLRVGDYRVYYRIHFEEVVILAVLNRKESDRWLSGR